MIGLAQRREIRTARSLRGYWSRWTRNRKLPRRDNRSVIMSVRMTAKIIGHLAEPQVKHYHGLPPDLTGGHDLREKMEAPVLVIIEEKSDGVFLFRFTADGQVVGDTWHMTVEEAKQQADFEFPGLLSDWKSVPAEVEDVVTFALDD